MESVYFAATCEFEDIGKLYLNRGGIWGEFSVFETVLVTTIESIKYHYRKWNNCEISHDPGVDIEKVTINVTFKDIFN